MASGGAGAAAAAGAPPALAAGASAPAVGARKPEDSSLAPLALLLPSSPEVLTSALARDESPSSCEDPPGEGAGARGVEGSTEILAR